MTTLLGPIGGLIDIACPSKLTRGAGGVSYSSSTSVTGRRVNAQLRAERRVWNLDTSVLTPERMAALEAFTYGGFGTGPWYFVPADAPLSNMVTPWDSLMGSASHRLVTTPPAGWVGAGARTMLDGTVVPGSYIGAGGGSAPILHEKAIPLPPDRSPITISAWVNTAGTQLRFRWTDSTGAQTGSWFGSGMAATDATAERIYVTATPPENVFGVFVAADASATLIAGLQVTWTDHLLPYAPGRGCTSAVLDQVATETVAAFLGARYDTASYAVTELG